MLKLTQKAEDDREEFNAEYGRDGNCSCHLHPPCSSCLHPGNPDNQVEDPECWEQDPDKQEPFAGEIP